MRQNHFKQISNEDMAKNTAKSVVNLIRYQLIYLM